MEKELIDIISNRHIRSYDKWYRMCAGLSSNLIDLDDGVLYLTIYKSNVWKKDDIVTARQFATEWKSNNPELKTARKYEVKIISTGGAPGFMIRTDDLSAVSALINSLKVLEEEKKDRPANNNYIRKL
ncbi:MAG: hypothetical protein IPI77_18215 [Saprospiraceae bacterium]|nr:hypothetical protein [Saprospiraceae bacterium]